MKIRTNYVSNSSSSSFVIAYDEAFFGDLMSLFKINYLGCESKVRDSNNMQEFYDIYCDSDEEVEDLKKKIEKFEVNDKRVLYLSVDNEFEVVVNLLKQIGNATGNKIDFLYDGSEY